MLNLNEILSPQRITVDLDIHSKRRMFSHAAQLFVQSNQTLSENDILDALNERERLGITGIGEGIALPHARLPGLRRTVAAIIRLKTPIAYECIDDKPIDLVVVLLVAEKAAQDHLDILALLAEKLRNIDLIKQLREAEHADAVFQIICS